jgi:hypothetical protein
MRSPPDQTATTIHRRAAALVPAVALARLADTPTNTRPVVPSRSQPLRRPPVCLPTAASLVTLRPTKLQAMHPASRSTDLAAARSGLRDRRPRERSPCRCPSHEASTTRPQLPERHRQSSPSSLLDRRPSESAEYPIRSTSGAASRLTIPGVRDAGSWMVAGATICRSGRPARPRLASLWCVVPGGRDRPHSPRSQAAGRVPSAGLLVARPRSGWGTKRAGVTAPSHVVSSIDHPNHSKGEQCRGPTHQCVLPP